MVDRGLQALIGKVAQAAAEYRAALGADSSIIGRPYDDAVRARSLRLIESGREYERAADVQGIAASERVRWTQYLLPAGARVGLTAPGPDEGSEPSIITLIGAAMDVIDQAGAVDDDAWQAMRRDGDTGDGHVLVAAVGHTDVPPPGSKTDLPAVAEIVASREYRDALHQNLEIARAWVATLPPADASDEPTP